MSIEGLNISLTQKEVQNILEELNLYLSSSQKTLAFELPEIVRFVERKKRCKLLKKSQVQSAQICFESWRCDIL